MAAAAVGELQSAAMAGGRLFVTVLAAALVFAGAALGDENRPRLLGAPVDISAADNDDGLQRALQFAMEEYNKASNDMYSSRVVRVIRAKKQIVSGIKYTMEVEIARTTCPKPADNLQSCALHHLPQMAKHTICTFVVHSIPWQNEMRLLQRTCQ